MVIPFRWEYLVIVENVERSVENWKSIGLNHICAQYSCSCERFFFIRLCSVLVEEFRSECLNNIPEAPDSNYEFRLKFFRGFAHVERGMDFRNKWSNGIPGALSN